MHYTKDHVALTNISQETNYFHDSVQYPVDQSSSLFLSLGYVLCMLLKLEHF